MLPFIQVIGIFCARINIPIFFSLCLLTSGGTWREVKPYRPSAHQESLWRRSTCHPISPPSLPSTTLASSTSFRESRDGDQKKEKEARAQSFNRTLNLLKTTAVSLIYIKLDTFGCIKDICKSIPEPNTHFFHTQLLSTAIFKSNLQHSNRAF